MKNLFKKTILLVCSCFLAINLQATVRYVAPNGTTAATNVANATSWATACADLQAVINASAANDTIFVAAGTYKPNRRADDTSTITANNRNNAFVLKKDVKIFGSFAGTESTLDERRLPTNYNYTSILSGDFNGNDGGNAQSGFTGMSENAHHVVISAGDAGTASLDGFTISGGNADGTGNITVNSKSIPRNYGGGMHNCDIASRAMIMKNINISGNSANISGGGMYNNNSTPVMITISISGNKATSSGGGIDNNSSSPGLINVIINGNTANSGGGMSNNTCVPILTNVIICGNTATGSGGGMINYYSNPYLTNVTVSGNTANNGSGMYNEVFASPKIRNSIIWGNGDNNIGNYGSTTPNYNYSLIEGCGSSGDDWNSNFGIDNGNNIDTNPLFVDAANGDFRLQLGSPCIDAGSNVFFATGLLVNISNITTDFAGNPRFAGNSVDMGAYERQDTTFSDLLAIIAELEADNAVLNNQISNLQSDLTGCNTNNINLQNQITGLQSDTTALNNQINNLQSDLTGCNINNINLQNQVTGLQNDTATLNNQINNLQNALTDCNTSNSNLQNKNITLQNQLDSLQNENDNLQELLEQCQQGAGIENVQSTPLKIYPNPVQPNGILTFENETLKYGDKIEIYNMSGKLVSTHFATGTNNSIQVGSLPQGVYLLKLAGKNGVKFEVK